MTVQPTPSVSVRPASPAQLLDAVRLGVRAAAADLAGRPEDARLAYAGWRRLRRHARPDARHSLRVAFDTGYGRGMHAGGLVPPVPVPVAAPTPRRAARRPRRSGAPAGPARQR